MKLAVTVMNTQEQQQMWNLRIVATVTEAQKKWANVNNKLPVELTQTNSKHLYKSTTSSNYPTHTVV